MREAKTDSTIKWFQENHGYTFHAIVGKNAPQDFSICGTRVADIPDIRQTENPDKCMKCNELIPKLT